MELARKTNKRKIVLGVLVLAGVITSFAFLGISSLRWPLARTTVASCTAKQVLVIGLAHLDGSQFKFEEGSLRLALGNDEIEVPSSDDFAFGLSDFTFDFWVRFNGLPTSGTYQTFFLQWQSESNYLDGWVNIGGNGHLQLNYESNVNGSDHYVYAGVPTIVVNQWYHIAYVRANLTVTIYLNGVAVGKGPDTNSIPPFSYTINNDMQIGSDVQSTGDGPSDAWYNEFRISNNARWTSNFEPTSAQYGRDTHTILLLHLDHGIYDSC